VVQLASNDPDAGIEVMVVHGEAPHQGGWETFLGRGWLGRTLGRVMDGLETAFVGGALVFGGIAATLGIALFSPVIGTAVLLAGQPPFKTVGSLLLASGQIVPWGARFYAVGPFYLPLNIIGGLAATLAGTGWHGSLNFMETGPLAYPARIF
jgi:hypothetical protein